MGLLLLVVIWLITFVSTYFFLAKTWWLPVGASAASRHRSPFRDFVLDDGPRVRRGASGPRVFCLEISRAERCFGALFARKQHAGIYVDGAYVDSVCRHEYDESLHLGGRTF